MKIFEKIKNIASKKYMLPVALAAAAICALLLSGGGKEGRNDAKIASALFSTELEERIEKLCESVSGVRNVKVLLTLDTSEEYVLATDSERNGEYERREIVRVDSGDGITLYVVSPKIRGVAIVCTGGERASVKKTIGDLVSVSLGIPSSKVSVAGS